MFQILKPGAIGQAVANLQARLRTAGLDVPATGMYDDTTREAVKRVQRTRGLVVDGVYGPKTAAALQGVDLTRLLQESDLIAAAARLGVPLAAVKAVNAVESRGAGFLPDGRAVILYERHIMARRLREHGIDPEPHITRNPSIVNTVRGGYAGGAAEYVRLATASEIYLPAALEATSWGAFQIMGYHWQRLAYASIDEFVQAARNSEGGQLEMFVRFIEADPSLHKALQGRKWAQFARGYNGPAYAENLYDVKLARAYERFAPATNKAAP